MENELITPSGHNHSFDTGIANKLGINAAVIYNHIIYWLRINAAKGNNILEGKVWMYETQTDIAKCLDYLTVEEVKKAIVKLLNAGLIIKENFNKNPFDKTNWYTTSNQSIFQKTLTKAPYGAIDESLRREGERPMAPCYIQKEQHKEKQQQQAAAVFYEILLEVDIPDAQKQEISRTYSQDDVIHGLKWIDYCRKAGKPIHCLVAMLKWACKHKPEIPASEEDKQAKNKAYAAMHDEMKSEVGYVNALSKSVEIVFPTSQKEPINILYKENGFFEKFQSALRKINISPLPS